jgi:hypothetical protein
LIALPLIKREVERKVIAAVDAVPATETSIATLYEYVLASELGRIHKE